MNKISNDSLAAFHPGFYIKKYLDARGMKQSELANRLNVSEKVVSNLVHGEINLTDDLAEGLSLVFGTSVDLWMNLNKIYFDKKRKIEESKKVKDDEEILKQMDYSFWSNQGFVKKTRKAEEKVKELRKFFQISSLKTLKSPDFLVQYKTAVANVQEKNIINSNAWVQTALNLASQVEVDELNLDYLRSSLNDIRRMTSEKPEKFMPKLNEIFKKSGVAFVIVPNLKNCGINGAVKWLGKQKVLLAINDRRKYSDVFWFALFHEIKHVFQKKIGHTIISADDNIGITSALDLRKLEEEADSFARDFLISPSDYSSFVNNENYSYNAIVGFSKQIGIQPGIVVGRLQRDGLLEYNRLNILKNKYKIVIK